MRAKPSHPVWSASYRWCCTTNREVNTSTHTSVAMSKARTARRTSRQAPRSWVCTQPQMYPTTGLRMTTDAAKTIAQNSDIQMPSRKYPFEAPTR